MEFVEVVDIDNRTVDISEGVKAKDFASMLISQPIVDGLINAGFVCPSPVQLRAIPVGQLGLDLVVQAKSGTGKTLVFAILSLESINVNNRSPQVLIVAPTHEIADQIADTIMSIGAIAIRDNGLSIGIFIGGTNLKTDQALLRAGCHIIIGTPGRLVQLVHTHQLDLSSIGLFVLDEADKLMEENFQKRVNYLFSLLPPRKQVAVFSATYPQRLDAFLTNYMRSPTMIRLNATDVQLIGIKQYVVLVPNVDWQATNDDWMRLKVRILMSILQRIEYSQCLIFSNYIDKCEQVCQLLNANGYEAMFISATLNHNARANVIKKLKLFQTKMLISTDLTARGISAHNVNLVINLEQPYDAETYFHRIGRAGRYGRHGAAITIAIGRRDVNRFLNLAKNEHFQVKKLEIDTIVMDICTNEEYWKSLPSIDFTVEPNNDNDEIIFYGKPTTTTATVVTKHEAAKKKKKKKKPRKPKNDDLPSLVDDDNIHRPLQSSVDDDDDDDDHKHQSPPSLSESSSSSSLLLLDSNAADRKVYSRTTMFNIRDSLSESFIDSHPFANIPSVQLTKCIDYDDELDAMKSLLLVNKKNQPTSSSMPTPPVPPAPFRFVPSRLRNKTKYYMRGELLSIGAAIRDGVNKQRWHEYVAKKWNLNLEPFTIATDSPATNIVYNRAELLTIRNRIDIDQLRRYAIVKWSDRTEPFVFDDELRRPFEQQLRIVRDRERIARQHQVQQQSSVSVDDLSKCIADTQLYLTLLQNATTTTNVDKAPSPPPSVRRPYRVSYSRDEMLQLWQSVAKCADRKPYGVCRQTLIDTNLLVEREFEIEKINRVDASVQTTGDEQQLMAPSALESTPPAPELTTFDAVYDDYPLNWQQIIDNQSMYNVRFAQIANHYVRAMVHYSNYHGDYTDGDVDTVGDYYQHEDA